MPSGTSWILPQEHSWAIIDAIPPTQRMARAFPLSRDMPTSTAAVKQNPAASQGRCGLPGPILPAPVKRSPVSKLRVAPRDSP